MRNPFSGLKNYLLYGSGQLINLLTPLLIAPKLIAVTGMENFGKVGVVTAIFTILLTFVDFGSLLLGVKNLSVNKHDREKVRQQLSETYAFRGLMTLLLLSITTLAIVLFSEDPWLYFLGMSFLLAPLFNPLWVYQAFEDFQTINRIIFISKFIYIALVYLLVTQPADYIYALCFLGLANGMVYTVYFYKLHTTYQLFIFRVSPAVLLQNFKREYPIVVSSLSISTYTSAPILIISHLLGEYMAGIYNVGDILLKILRNYLSVFFNVSFPKFCVAFSANPAEGYRYLRKANALNIALLATGTALAYFLTFFIADMVALDSRMLEVAQVGVHFVGLGVVIALNIPFYQMLIYHNQQKVISVISITGTLIMLSSCYLLTHFYHLSGSILSLYAVELFMTGAIVFTYFFKKRSIQMAPL